eukprot:3018384-Pyramimonas_sp.AAC.1
MALAWRFWRGCHCKIAAASGKAAAASGASGAPGKHGSSATGSARGSGSSRPSGSVPRCWAFTVGSSPTFCVGWLSCGTVGAGALVMAVAGAD